MLRDQKLANELEEGVHTMHEPTFEMEIDRVVAFREFARLCSALGQRGSALGAVEVPPVFVGLVLAHLRVGHRL